MAQDDLEKNSDNKKEINSGKKQRRLLEMSKNNECHHDKY